MSDHESRLTQMESWYSSLLAGGTDHAARQFLSDYEPHAHVLARLKGRVLDVGGGAGLAARFLRPNVDYVVVDPSRLWASGPWQAFSDSFRGNGPAASFVEASAEALPFETGSFDAVIALWSLNHVSKPETCMTEMIRVLTRGGCAYMILEDIEPRWTDIFRDVPVRIAAKLGGRGHKAQIHQPLLPAISAKLQHRWPVQEDHLPVDERELMRWAEPLRLISRRWMAGSLALEFRKS